MADDNTLPVNISISGTDTSKAVMQTVSTQMRALATDAQNLSRTLSRDLGQPASEQFRRMSQEGERHLGPSGLTGVFKKLSDGAAGYIAELATLGGAEEVVRRSFTAFAENTRGFERFGLIAGTTTAQINQLKEELSSLASVSGESIGQLQQQIGGFMAQSGLSLQAAMPIFRDIVETADVTGASIETMSRTTAAAINNLKVPLDQVRNVIRTWAVEIPPQMMQAFSQAAPRITTTMDTLGLTGAKNAAQLGAAFVQLERAFGSSRLAATSLNDILQKMSSVDNPLGQRLLPQMKAGDDLLTNMDRAFNMMDSMQKRLGGDSPMNRSILQRFLGLDPTQQNTLTVIHNHMQQIREDMARGMTEADAFGDVIKRFGKDPAAALADLEGGIEDVKDAFGLLLETAGASGVLKEIADEAKAMANGFRTTAEYVDYFVKRIKELTGINMPDWIKWLLSHAAGPAGQVYDFQQHFDEGRTRFRGMTRGDRLRRQMHGGGADTDPSMVHPSDPFSGGGGLFSPTSYVVGEDRQRAGLDASKANTEALKRLTDYLLPGRSGGARIINASYGPGGGGAAGGGGSAAGGGDPSMIGRGFAAHAAGGGSDFNFGNVGSAAGAPRTNAGGGAPAAGPHSGTPMGAAGPQPGDPVPAGGRMKDAASFDKVFKGTPLEGHWGDVVGAAHENGIDPSLMAAVMAHETGHGRVTAGNNVAGIMDPRTGDRTKQHFGSIQEGIAAAGRTISKNWRRAGGDINRMGHIYAPVGAANDPHGLNRGWAAGVEHYYGGDPSGGHATAAVGDVTAGGYKGVGDYNFMGSARARAMGMGDVSPGSPSAHEHFETGLPKGEGPASITANKYAGSDMVGFLRDLHAAGAPLSQFSGVYANRGKRGGGGASQHAYGNAMDIETGFGSGPNNSPALYAWAKAHPKEFAEIQAKHHMRNLDTTSGAHMHDWGHFEWTPTERAAAAAGAGGHEAVNSHFTNMLRAHRAMRSEMERPIKTQLEPPQHQAWRQRARRQTTRWANEDVVNSARYGASADIGLA